MNIYVFLSIITIMLTAPLTTSTAENNDPVEVYDSYLSTVKDSNSLEELKPYVSKRAINIFESLSEDQKLTTLNFKKSIANNTIRKEIKSEVNNNITIITINAVDKSSNKNVVATVEMLLEEGQWKVDKEKFDFIKAE